MLGFFLNMAPLSTIDLQTILGFLNQVLRILVKNVGSTAIVLVEKVSGSLYWWVELNFHISILCP